VSPDLVDRTVRIEPDAHVVQGFFSFSRPNGSAIGIVTVIAPDTNYYRCSAWVPPTNTTCLQWTKVSSPPYDSIWITLDTTGYLDTNKVKLYTGSLTALGGSACGNIDGELPANVDISDLSYLVSYLYIGGPPPAPLSAGNVDCSSDGGLDISDLSALVDHLYVSLTPLCCETP